MGERNVDRLSDVMTKEFPQFGFDGELPVWGKDHPRGVWKLIPSEVWEKNGLDWFSLIKGVPEELKTEPKHSTRNRNKWRELMTCRQCVETLWPVENT